MVFPSDSVGCLLNASEANTATMFVSGRNFRPGERVELSVVDNQRAWYSGDSVNDATGLTVEGRPDTVQVGADGRFTRAVWAREGQRGGAYDIIARRVDNARRDRRLHPSDIVSFDRETAFLLFLTYPPGGPHMDIAGRPLGGSPYFEFADAFAETGDPVWGAVDPTYVPASHPGGTYAAYYVVNHRSAAQWLADQTLTDVSGGIEIHPVKAGCVNGTDTIIWNAPLVNGQHDVVVEFGTSPANTAAAFSGDGTYDPTVDFLDGAVQVGFTVARDPWELGPIPIGSDSYSDDDYFASLGVVANVDLRAVVRYPATAAGAGTPVAAGTHPLFVIEHGNHGFCRIGGQTHASCPVASRVRNHEGYMRLLDILASHGVIAVSIDAYDLTGVAAQLISERGNLILRHLELWSHMHDATTHTTYPDFFAGRFAGKVDLSRIGVSGHSRGGEASVASFMINAASANPFSITSVSSIAPVDGQAYTLPAVPYFVILPSADCDVSSLSGQRIYDRAGGATDAATKSAIVVYGANHNFFNTVWAADGDDCFTLPRDDYIAAAAQQRIGEAYLAGFHLSSLMGSVVYEDLLRHGLTFPSVAGYKIHGERHEASHRKLVNGGVPAGLVGSGGATLGTSTNPSPHSTTATLVTWPTSSGVVTYTVPAAQRDASTFEVLSFRAAQASTMMGGVTAANVNFRIELVGGAVTRGVYVGQFDLLPPRYLHPEGNVHTVMTTVRIPLHSFIMNNSGLPLGSIETIRLSIFSPTAGAIHVDDIEFAR